MRDIQRRIEKAEKQLCINDDPVVFAYTDENGDEQRIEMPPADFDNLLKEIRAESKGIQIKESVGI